MINVLPLFTVYHTTWCFLSVTLMENKKNVVCCSNLYNVILFISICTQLEINSAGCNDLKFTGILENIYINL